MKQISLSSLCLYLLGHSVFLVFLLQTITVVIVADWYQSVVSIVAMMVHILYLTYAIVRVLSPVRWSAFFKGVGVLIVVYALYNFASTRLVYGVYYKILHRSGMIFRTAPDVRIAYTEKPSTTVEANEPVEYKMERILDSLRIVVDCAHSDAGEVSKIILSAWVKRKQLWSMPLFEKTRRYSPDPREVLVDIDSASHTAFVFYRIANDTNANIQIMATDVVTGLLKFRTSLQPASDDLHITDIAMDSDFVYLCGSTQYKFGNFDLGMIVMINKSTGIVNLREIGSTSFASWTSFQKISVLPKSIEVAERRNYRWLFLFTKSSSALWTIQKDELVAITKK